MVNYKCDKCGKEFKQKGHYMYHINRKIPCKVTIPDSSNELHKNSEKLQNDSGKLQINSVVLYEKQNNELKSVSASENDILSCKMCSKVFSKKSNLTRHLNGRCRKQANSNETNEEILRRLLAEYEEKYRSEMVKQKNELEKKME